MKHLLGLIIFAVSIHAQNPNSQLDECRTILRTGLQDKNPDTRKQAVIALSLVGRDTSAIADLEKMLDDKDVEVRLAAIASLVDLKPEGWAKDLHKALNDEVPEVSFAAAKALWTLGDPDGKAALLSVISGETKTSSGFFTKQKRDAIRMMHTPKTMFLFSLRTGVGFAPIPGLGAGVASMQGLLSDPSVSGRAAAALLLSREKDPDTIEALKDALLDKDWSVRAAAVHALALHDDATLQAALVPMLSDSKEPVRLRAAAGYVRLGSMKNTAKPARKKATVPPKR